MEPYWKTDNGELYQGNTLELLKELPEESVDCIVTSPPYWGLRDYGEKTNIVWGGEKDCKHEWIYEFKQHSGRGDCQSLGKYSEQLPIPDKLLKSSFCRKCGAWYGQLGLEPTVDLYLEHLLLITKELKRVLKRTGVMFWNHGDNYGGSGGATGKANHPETHPDGTVGGRFGLDSRSIDVFPKRSVSAKYKSKCMVMQNYRLVFRMIEEQGWILRNIIIWNKPNSMPSSVTDRFSNVYEPVFMLTKNRQYWFDLDAVRIPYKASSIERKRYPMTKMGVSKDNPLGRFGKGIKQGNEGTTVEAHPLGRNPGDVWTVSTQGLPEAHFATFPERLIEPMIKAGCPQWICKKCGKARERIIEIEKKVYAEFNTKGKDAYEPHDGEQFYYKKRWHPIYKTIGWTDCGCNAGWKAGVVLDPFMGSGTVGYVAERLNRRWIGLELNPEYCEIAKRRIRKISAGTLF